MIIKSNLQTRKFFDFIDKMGRWINPGINSPIDDIYIQNPILARYITLGKFEVISYNSSISSTVQQDEVTRLIDSAITSPVIKIPFTYLSVSPLLLAAIPINKTLEYINVKIIDAFDETKYMSIGFSEDHSEIFTTYDLDITKVENYYTDPFRKSSSSENLYAYFTGTSTKGSGIVYINII